MTLAEKIDSISEHMQTIPLVRKHLLLYYGLMNTLRVLLA